MLISCILSHSSDLVVEVAASTPGSRHMVGHFVFSATICRSGLSEHYMSPAEGCGFINKDEEEADDEEETEDSEELCNKRTVTTKKKRKPTA